MSRILALTRDLVLLQVAPPSRSSGGAALARAAVLLDQIHARQRNVELGVGGVLDQHEVAGLFALRDCADRQRICRRRAAYARRNRRASGRRCPPGTQPRLIDRSAGCATSSEVSNRSSEPNIASLRVREDHAAANRSL